MKINLCAILFLILFKPLFAASILQEDFTQSRNPQQEMQYLRFKTKNQALIQFCSRANMESALRIIKEEISDQGNLVTMEIERTYFQNDLIPTLLEIYSTTLQPEYKELIPYFFYKFNRSYFTKQTYETIKHLIYFKEHQTKKYRKKRSHCGPNLKQSARISSGSSQENSNSTIMNDL